MNEYNYYLELERQRRAAMENFGYSAREDNEPESFYDFDVFSAYPKQIVEQEKAMPSGYDTGHNFGAALAALFTVNPNVTYSKVINVAQKFAAWEGYRGDLQAGLEYISGFTDGFFANQPRQIQEKAE